MPLHIPRNDAMGRGSWEWWTQPLKIGGWMANDVLALPDEEGNWIYDINDVNVNMGRYMVKYGAEDAFPYVMSGLWQTSQQQTSQRSYQIPYDVV